MYIVLCYIYIKLLYIIHTHTHILLILHCFCIKWLPAIEKTTEKVIKYLKSNDVCEVSYFIFIKAWRKEWPHSLNLHIRTLYTDTDYEGHSLCLLIKSAQGQRKSDFITSALMKQKKALLELHWSCVRIKRPIKEGKVRKTVFTP